LRRDHGIGSRGHAVDITEGRCAIPKELIDHVGKDLATNTLWVVQGHDHPWLLSDRLLATSPAWVGPIPEAGRRLAVRTRYRQADAACVVHAADAQGLELSFDEPQRAVTPGQSAVLYDAEVCLGGAIIEVASAASATRNEICPVDSAALSR